jgi:hypothetical protein
VWFASRCAGAAADGVRGQLRAEFGALEQLRLAVTRQPCGTEPDAQDLDATATATATALA